MSVFNKFVEVHGQYKAIEREVIKRWLDLIERARDDRFYATLASTGRVILGQPGDTWTQRVEILLDLDGEFVEVYDGSIQISIPMNIPLFETTLINAIKDGCQRAAGDKK